jgi:hypothetical protein
MLTTVMQTRRDESQSQNLQMQSPVFGATCSLSWVDLVLVSIIGSRLSSKFSFNFTRWNTLNFYRMKALIFTLVRAFQFELAVPAKDIVKQTASVQRPVLLSDPDGGNQMPLLIKPCSRT